MKYGKIGLFGHFLDPEIRQLAEETAVRLHDLGAEVFALETEGLSGDNINILASGVFQAQIDALLVFGGDGTFLRAADQIKYHAIPILGINKGHLGFLSEIEADELPTVIPRILVGDFSIDERMMIEGTVWRDQIKGQSFVGLNDVVVSRDPFQNTVVCETYLEEQLIEVYSGDGLIIATPTGATGYSLSARGPLIYPGTDCMIVNPICPHHLGANAVIVPADGDIRTIIRRSEKNAHLFIDGRFVASLQEGDVLTVCKADMTVQLIHVKTHPYFNAVRNKLLDRPYRMVQNGGQ